MDRFDLVDGEKMYLENGKYCEWEDVKETLELIDEICWNNDVGKITCKALGKESE